MKPRRIVLTIEVEQDTYRDGDWRYRIRLGGKIIHQGHGTPAFVMQLAQEALQEAGR